MSAPGPPSRTGEVTSRGLGGHTGAVPAPRPSRLPSSSAPRAGAARRKAFTRPQPRIPEVEVRDGGIRLGQFIKLAGLADGFDTGGEIKLLIADGEVRVNGEVETRRGRQLAPGDVVDVGGRAARVV